MNNLLKKYGTFIYVDTDSIKDTGSYIHKFVYTLENRSNHKRVDFSTYITAQTTVLKLHIYVMLLNKIYAAKNPGNWILVNITYTGVEQKEE